MKEFKGTKGPWVTVQKYADDISVVDSQGFRIVTAERTAILMDWHEKGMEHWGDEGGSKNLSGPEQFSNASLIAAAPDLLEALQEVISGFESLIDAQWEPMEEHDKERINKARSAIAKALGETK